MRAALLSFRRRHGFSLGPPLMIRRFVNAASGRYSTAEPSRTRGLETAPGPSRIGSDGQDETRDSLPKLSAIRPGLSSYAACRLSDLRPAPRSTNAEME